MLRPELAIVVLEKLLTVQVGNQDDGLVTEAT